ncbi:GNAT family N-acetyltransferase [Senimuribacter intestinalis]|uniref:GNAT family N-acetyltransferase n=1 Tax=Senimuribacter intestinalis TaxID=2941507 RepID=UPI00203C95B2|nr:N-acetyltransferase [Senimuribacter intestinalis]
MITSRGKDNMLKVNITIREEQEKDYRRVEEITREAFSYPGRIEDGGIGCPYEHWMVHELRRRDGIPGLSLVAEIDETIAGHVICSKAEVRMEDRTIPVLNFGPISVLPELQRKGVGKALLTGMIAKAKKMGFGAILFFGRPEYYPQFGFKEAYTWGITDLNGNHYPAFMGMELIPGYLSSAKGGKYYESDIYDDELNAKRVKAYDEENFPFI